MYTVDHTKNFQGLNLGFQAHNPLSFLTNHFISYETNGELIRFIMFFITNVLQKTVIIIIIFLILCPMKRIKFQSINAF